MNRRLAIVFTCSTLFIVISCGLFNQQSIVPTFIPTSEHVVTVTVAPTATLEPEIGPFSTIFLSPIDTSNVSNLSSIGILESDISDYHEEGDLVFSPDGRFLALGRYLEIEWWQLPSGNLQQKLALPDYSNSSGFLSFDKSSAYLAVDLGNGNIAVWDIKKRSIINTFWGLGWVRSLEFAQGSLIVVGRDERVEHKAGFGVFDALTGEYATSEIDKFEGNPSVLATNSTGSLFAYTFQRDGSYSVALYDTESRKLIRELKSDNGINAISFNADGSLLATGSGQITIWDLSNGNELLQFESLENPIFSPTDESLLAGFADNRLSFWNAKDGTHIMDVDIQFGPLAWSADGRLIAAVEAEARNIQIWGILNKDMATPTPTPTATP